MGRPRMWGGWKGEQGVGQSDAGPGPTGQRGSPEALLPAAIVPLKACSLGAGWSGQKGKASSSAPKIQVKEKPFATTNSSFEDCVKCLCGVGTC